MVHPTTLWRRANPEKALAIRQRYLEKHPDAGKIRYQKNKEQMSTAVKLWKKLNPEKVRLIDRRRTLKIKYNMTIEDYNNLLASQNGSCSICADDKNLVIDHCHTTNRVRGILCSTCNRGIGLMKDSVQVLQSAIEYLNGR